MASITLRNVKGSPLTNAEVDANFNNINTELVLKLVATDYNATDVISKIKGVSVATADINVNRLNGLSAATTNTVSTVVARDSNGDFTAGTITAGAIIATTLTGTLTGNVTGTLTGNSTNVNGVIAITNGGTGSNDAPTARTALGLGSIATQSSASVQITGGTITGLGTPLPIASGGTGSGNAAGARTSLGLSIGSDIQPYSAELIGLAASTSTGIYVRLAAGSVAQRSIAVGGNGLTIANASGVAGNPTISLPTSATPTFASLTTTAAISVGTTLGVTGATTLAGLTVANITSSGSITAVGNITGYFSDDRLKTKLGVIENALDKLCSLEGFYFEANQTAQDLGYTAKKEIGVSAQSVQDVLPEVIYPAAIDPQYMTVDYARMLPLVIQAIKELRAEIQALK
jgi:hypothetical protein